MHSLPPWPADIALIGAGRVGTAVASLLAGRGQKVVGVASRTHGSAERAADVLETQVFELRSAVAADIYLIGTGPGAIEKVVRQLNEAIDLTGRVVVHFSGAHGVAPVSAAHEGGAHVCALHPVQACPDVDSAIRNLPGSAWGVTTSEGAEAWARDFVELLGGTPVPVPEEVRVPWHAAAVVTSNGIAALLAGGEQILRAIGVNDPISVLGPLATGTVSNATLGGGGARTLTGPVVRGEAEVVRMHAAALHRMDRELAETYEVVSQLIARVAIGSGRLQGTDVEAITTALKRSG